MQIKLKNINDLIPSEHNSRKNTKKQQKQLSESLKKFGCVEPIIVNEHKDRYNIIIGGHFRVEELKKLNIKEVECVIVNLPLELEKELNIRLNANTGEWNYDLLLNNEIWNIEDLNDWGLDTPVYKEEDFSEIISLEKSIFQQITFVLFKNQTDVVNNALGKAKNSDEYKYINTDGNNNSNGNALFIILLSISIIIEKFYKSYIFFYYNRNSIDFQKNIFYHSL